MDTAATAPAPAVIDVAALALGNCRATIEGTFEALAPGEALEVVVGHDQARRCASA